MAVSRRYALIILTTFIVAAAYSPSAAAQENREFDLVASHVKTLYRARRKPTPFMGIANLAVKVVRPAGVKSFKIATYEDLYSPTSTGPVELNAGVRRALGEEWQPLVHIHARDGEQTVVYAREAEKDVKLLVVIVSGDEATVLRVKLSPKGLAKWMADPKAMGLSLGSDTISVSR